MTEHDEQAETLIIEDAEEVLVKQKRKFWRKLKNLKRWQKALLVVAAVVLAVIVVLGVKTLLATKRILTATGSAPVLSGDISPDKLRKEGDSRVNILLLGIGGAGHDGPDLSDSIMIISIDPKTKTAAALSIPRDLYVPIGPNNKYGHAKINAAHAYGEQEDYPGGGPALAKQTVENLLDLPIHYYVRTDFNGFKTAVDAVGGVDVCVDKRLYDPYFPLGETGDYTVVNIAAGCQHMNGQLALEYARSRETTSDFDRAARQQKIILGLKDKVFSAGTLANPAKVSKLIDTVGTHVKTDLSLSDLMKLIKLTKLINNNTVQKKVLDTSDAGLLKFGFTQDAGSIEVPQAGIDNFLDIQILTHTLFPDPYIAEEHSAVEVQNGTYRSGLATTVTKLLKGYGYNVVNTTTAPQQNYTKSVLYDYSGGKKPYTINYLERRFGVKAVKAARPTGSSTDITLIVGSDYEP